MPRGDLRKRSAVPISAQNLFNALAANLTIAASTVDICTINITLAGQRTVSIWSSWCIQISAGAVGFVFIEVDGVTKVSCTIQNAAADYYHGAINWEQSMAAGARTIKLKATVNAGSYFIRPVLVPNDEFANLKVQEQPVG